VSRRLGTEVPTGRNAGAGGRLRYCAARTGDRGGKSDVRRVDRALTDGQGEYVGEDVVAGEVAYGLIEPYETIWYDRCAPGIGGFSFL
jgi:hypothetical protein